MHPTNTKRQAASVEIGANPHQASAHNKDDIGALIGKLDVASRPSAPRRKASSASELRVGIENVTDEDPPIVPSSKGPNTDSSQYDVLGRRYYASLRYSF